MNYIPSNPSEVKSIIEAVNLKTYTRFQYLKSDCGVCKFPLACFPDGFNDLRFTPDGLLFDGADPDAEITLTDPPDVQPGDPVYAGDPTLYFERQPRPGEVKEGHLVALRAQALAKANPREVLYQEESLPAPRRDNIVELPRTEKQPDRRNSVGDKLKLAWLPVELYEAPAFQKLKLGEQELYRIYRTYCKRAGGKSKNSYVQIGVSQASDILDRRKKDMLGSSNLITRKAAEKIGTHEKTIRNYSLSLLKVGWIKKVLRGRPRKENPYVNKYLVVKSEKQRLKRIVDRKRPLS